ncbi:MAG: hypothetical protein H0V27_08635 [Pyrinomonadaceae bacterium]|jgi:hypothetical protein|nr:hypothetical protein [Pyrinomonadaceae bacterium]
MKRLIYLFDQRLNLITLLLLFWALFWCLDGFDKFIDSNTEILFDKWASRGSVVDANNNVVYTIQPLNNVGWFGVNYADQMASYFKTIHVPRNVAIGLTYTFAVFEILTGFLFLILFAWQLLPDERKDRRNMLTDRTLHRLAYKSSVILFVILSIAYQIFGDRTRLWEVGTYMLMTLIAYDMWYRTDRFMLDMRRKRLAGIDDDDDTNSVQASAYSLRDKRQKESDSR